MHKAIEEVQIEKLKNALADDPNVVFAVLFGSRVRGKTLKGLQKSDIDLAVYFKNPPEGLALLDYISKLSDRVGDEIDLVVLNRASAFLRHQVMKERVLLICKDQEIYRRFREKTISDYQEYKYISGMEKNMIDRELVEKKLRRIEELVKEISSIEINSFENFKNDIIKKRFIERNMELAVEQMVSICKHLVSALDLREPQTYSECMDILYEAGIVKKQHLETYKSIIRFRNLLIHGYDGIDDSITYGIYKKRLGDFYLFAREIRDYLSLLKNN